MSERTDGDSNFHLLRFPEIPDFLLSQECKEIINHAKQVGMETSLTVSGQSEAAESSGGEEPLPEEMGTDDRKEFFGIFDKDGDKKISTQEVEMSL